MSSLRDTKYYASGLNGLATNGYSEVINVADFQSVQFSIQTTAPADFDITVIGSIQKDIIDPTTAVSVTNDWTDDVAYIDIASGATYNSTSPYNPNGGASKIFRVNVNQLTWFAIRIANRNSGTITVSNITLGNDQ